MNTKILSKQSSWLLLASLLAVLLLLALPGPAQAQEHEGREAYFVQYGDTIEKIAFLHGLDEKLVAAMNNVGVTDRLAEGRRIWLPLEPVTEEPEPETVTINAGDTLWSLARAHDTTVTELCELNQITRPDLLKIGQTLILPTEESGSVSAGETKMVLARSNLASRSAGGFSWPVEGVISSVFGWRTRGWHSGLDIAADTGTPVYASASGIITQSGWRSDAYGYTVTMDHGNGLETLYAHNSRVLVPEGAFVREGQMIALVGETGNATGPHVHLEIRLHEVCQNPLQFLR